MPLRLGPGPVFVYESIVTARRWQAYALRSLFVTALLGCLATAWSSIENSRFPRVPPNSPRQLALLGQEIYSLVAGVQVALVLLAAPAATAGAICLDRARGTLTHMLVTDLSDGEIVLGKLAARLLPVAALVGSGLPVLALAGLLGGIIPEALLILTLVSGAVAVLGCALALLFSVRANKTHEVLMGVYALQAAWLLALPFWEMFAAAGWISRPPAWFEALNPFFLVYAPYAWPQLLSTWHVAAFLGLTLGLSALLVVFAVRVLRWEQRPPRERSERWEAMIRAVRERFFSWWPAPRLDDNPVLWREWYRSRPGRIGRIVTISYLVVVTVGIVVGLRDYMERGVGNGPDLLLLTNFLAVGFGLLILAAAAPTTLSEERVRGSLDVLLSTPMSTASIVLGKWLAVFRRGWPIVLLPAFCGFFAAFGADEIPRGMRPGMTPTPLTLGDRLTAWLLPAGFALAHVAAITSVGLAMGTWIKRPGRAVGASVALYIFAAIGWILVVELVIADLVAGWVLGLLPADYQAGQPHYYQLYNVVNQLLLAPSPMGAQVTPLEAIQTDWGPSLRPAIWVVLGLEIAAIFAFAAAVLGLVLLTFNACMGRMDEQTKRGVPPLALQLELIGEGTLRAPSPGPGEPAEALPG